MNNASPLPSGPASGFSQAPPAPSPPGNGPSVSEPYSELEARLYGREGPQVLQTLRATLEKEAEGLYQRIASKDLDRRQYALTQAYADAVEAALGFLGTLPARR